MDRSEGHGAEGSNCAARRIEVGPVVAVGTTGGPGPWRTGAAVPQWGTMRHRQYHIVRLWASGLPVPTMGGNLVVASSDATDDLDWELVYRSAQIHPLRQEPYDLEMRGPEGRFGGPAILVRSDGRSHVFRGVGTLDGFDPAAFGDDGSDGDGGSDT